MNVFFVPVKILSLGVRFFPTYPEKRKHHVRDCALSFPLLKHEQQKRSLIFRLLLKDLLSVGFCLIPSLIFPVGVFLWRFASSTFIALLPCSLSCCAFHQTAHIPKTTSFYSVQHSLSLPFNLQNMLLKKFSWTGSVLLCICHSLPISGGS